MKIIKAESGQTFIDIAMQEYGCVEGLMFILQDNNLSMDSDAVAGQDVSIRELTDITKNNKQVKQALVEINVKPNSQIVTAAPTLFYVNSGYVNSGYVD